MTAEVLVVIVNYNGGDMLLRSVEAVRRQTFTEYRQVVVDNASSDGSISGLKPAHPDIEVLEAGANLGFAAANNLAVKACPGTRWIALLNPDAFPEPDWLKTLVETAVANPGTASFASRTLDARNPSVMDGAGDAYHFSGRYRRRGYRRKADGRHIEREEIFSACGAAALYSRAAWEEVGGFDEDFFCYGEDVDLGFRLRLAGHRCLYVADAIVHHIGSATTEKESDFAVYHGHRNLVWTYVKNMPSPLFWIYLPLHIAVNMYIVIRYSLKSRWRVIFKAKWDAIKGLPGMWRKRREIQARRVASAWEIRKLMEKGWPRRR